MKQKTPALNIVKRSTLLTAVVLVLSACPSGTDYFADFRNVNFTDQTAFSDWVVDYGAAGTQSFNYITLTDAGQIAGSAAPEGLTSTASVYSLEIPNLLPNGDFADPLGGGIWSTNTGTFGISTSTLYGQGLTYNIISIEYIALDLTTLSDSLSGSEYHLSMSVGSENASYLFEHSDLSSDLKRKWEIGPQGSGAENWWQFPDSQNWGYLVIDSIANQYFTIGSAISDPGISQDGILDNVNIARDIDAKYQLILSRKPKDDPAPELVTGKYRASVWIKQDPSVDDATAGKNRYHAAAFTLGVSDISGGPFNGVSHTTVSFRAIDSWADWTRISVEFELQLPQLGQDAVPENENAILLFMIPGDRFGTPKAGSLLVAQPELEFISN